MVAVRNYLSLVKFSHTIFAMPFAFIGFFLALKHTSVVSFSQDVWIKLLMVILCMVFARNSAMSFNRYLDRHFDALNPRTAIREIPAGILSGKRVLLFTVINSILFFVVTYFINRICFFLAPVALGVILFYSYTKRFTALCHLVLGVGLSLAPIGAYLAVAGQFELLPLLFSFAVLFWVSGFDIIYALQDVEFDKSHQLHSIPALLGKPKALMVSNMLHVFSAVIIFIAGWWGEMGLYFWIGAAIFSGMLIYQHWIVRPDDLSRVNLAFMTTNGIASVVFAVFVIIDLIN